MHNGYEPKSEHPESWVGAAAKASPGDLVEQIIKMIRANENSAEVRVRVEYWLEQQRLLEAELAAL